MRGRRDFDRVLFFFFFFFSFSPTYFAAMMQERVYSFGVLLSSFRSFVSIVLFFIFIFTFFHLLLQSPSAIVEGCFSGHCALRMHGNFSTLV